MKDKKRVIIFGTNSIAANALAFYKEDGEFEVIAFTVDEMFVQEKAFLDLPVVPYEKIRDVFPEEDFLIFVAIGYSDLNRNRMQIMDRVRNHGYQLGSCISSKSITSNAEIGENAIIFPGVILDPYVSIGEGVLIASGAHIAHYCHIGDYCFISGGTVVAGSTNVGKNTIVGCNATIGHSINLGAFNFLGDGAIVCRNTEDFGVYIPQQTARGAMDSERMKKLLLSPISGKV